MPYRVNSAIWLKRATASVLSVGFLAGPVLAQGGPPPARAHTANSIQPVTLIAATEDPIATPYVEITVEGDRRIIRTNGIPSHLTGTFPNSGNPNAIAALSLTFSLPATPVWQGVATYRDLGEMGVAVNGVVFDPTAAEWYLGQRNGGWQYDPLGGAVALGIDTNHAHVQPDGHYHYHASPTGLLEELGVSPSAHSPIVGWSLDGHPIYAYYSWDGAGNVVAVSSSWQLKQGARPTDGDNPGGTHDGTFVADYEFVAGAGTLDECNGRFAVTPEFPDGTYAYYVTDVFPFIPRCFMATPAS